MNVLLLPLPILLAASLCPAQGAFLTSPSVLQGNPGNLLQSFTDGAGTRWQQIHGDLIGPARSIRGFRLRRDESLPIFPLSGSRQVTIEVWMGVGDTTAASVDFAQNFATPPVQVLPASTITLPDWTVPPAAGAPFDLDVQLATPFAYSGTAALVLEVRVLVDTTATHFVDAYSESAFGTAALPPVELGSGCVTGGLPFRQQASIDTTWQVPLTPQFEWSLGALFGSAGLPTLFVLGAQTVPITLPGFCETVWPTLDVLVPAQELVGLPLAVYNAPRITSPFDAAFVGSDVTVQTVSLDFAQAVPFVLSQGQRLTIPPLPPLPLPIVSLSGTVASPLADQVQYGGRILQFEY
jgi:hypothetical protein